MSLIPTGTDLKDCKAAFGIKRKHMLPLGEQNQDYGTLLKKDVKIGDKIFPLVGWLGADGKNMPVVAEYTENPEKSQDGQHDKPSLKLYFDDNGTLTEYAVAFKRVSKGEDGKVFHTGQTNFTPTMNLTFWPIVKRESAE
jgi:hypothetical protein